MFPPQCTSLPCASLAYGGFLRSPPLATLTVLERALVRPLPPQRPLCKEERHRHASSQREGRQV